VPVAVHTESMLGLVHETLLGASVDRLVLAAAELVGHLLSSRFARVGLRAASDLVGSAGDAFLGLLEGGLGGVGSHLLAGLGVLRTLSIGASIYRYDKTYKILPKCFGHDCGRFGYLFGSCVFRLIAGYRSDVR
jgi:hypothetical protein